MCVYIYTHTYAPFSLALEAQHRSLDSQTNIAELWQTDNNINNNE